MSKKSIQILGLSLIVGFLLFGAGLLFSQSEIILAKVGQIEITQNELNYLIEKYKPLKKEKGGLFEPEEKRRLLESLIKGVVITMEAEKEKLDQKPEIKTKLVMQRRETLSQEYVQTRIQPLVKMTDKDVEEKLKDYPNLVPKEILSLKEILVKTEKEAQGIYEALKKGGDFLKIAAEKSIANTKIHGGNMKPVSRGQLPRVIEEVAFSLKIGELSKPFKTDVGYYILFLEGKKERSPEEIKRLEDTIKEKVKQIELSKMMEEMAEKKVEELKSKVKVEVYYDRIQ